MRDDKRTWSGIVVNAGTGVGRSDILARCIPVWGTPTTIQPNAVQQMVNVVKFDEVHRAALMADHHLGYGVPIGGVIGYKEHVSPSGVGFDIACGNMAARLDAGACAIERSISEIMDKVFSEIQFGVGKSNPNAPDHDLFDDPAWDIPVVGKLKQQARQQLGTVGGGNHYVDLFVDENAHVWVGVHFGSRGLGHKIATHYIKQAGGRDGIDAPPCLLEVDSELGREYIAAMQLAGRYAYAGREWVVKCVAKILGAGIIETVHNHHNFAWNECHGASGWLWVVRKGATPAWPGQRGFIGATMAEPSVIVKGVDCAASDLSLRSTVHGAGRVMSRTQAAGKYKYTKGWDCGNRNCAYAAVADTHQYDTDGARPKCPECGSRLGKRRTRVKVRDGEISTGERLADVCDAGVELRGGGNDEAKRAYKRLDAVLDAHAGMIEVIHTLRPIGVAMAGD